MAMTEKSGWLVIKTRPRQERRASENLKNQSFKVYLPLILEQKIVRGKRKENASAMFPGYLFVESENAWQSFHKIKSTYGVASVLQFGNRIPLVLDEHLEAIRKLEQHSLVSAPTNAPAPGDEIEVIQGPFAGFSARVLELKGDARCVVLLNWVNGQTIKADFSYADLIK